VEAEEAEQVEVEEAVEAQVPVPQGYQKGLDLPRIFLPRFQDQDQPESVHTSLYTDFSAFATSPSNP